MVDPERGFRATDGYLRIEGQGGLTTRQMRDLLGALETAYGAVAGADLLVRQEAAATRAMRHWARRWGPPELFPPLAAYGLRAAGIGSLSHASAPLIVNRVVLTSPGFWEFSTFGVQAAARADGDWAGVI